MASFSCDTCGAGIEARGTCINYLRSGEFEGLVAHEVSREEMLAAYDSAGKDRSAGDEATRANRPGGS